MEGTLIRLRPITRSDRRKIERWPDPVVPAHWREVEFGVIGRRESLAICRADDGLLVGRVTLRYLATATAPLAFLGVYLHPEYYGRGYGTEAIRLVADAANQQGVRIELRVATDNPRARHAFQKAGFRYLGTETARDGIHTFTRMVR